MRHVRRPGAWRNAAAIFAFTVALLAGWAVPAGAGQNRWTLFGEGGGTIDDLVFTPGRIYAAVPTRAWETGEVYRSEDGGQSWIWASHGLPAGQIDSLAVLPGPTPVVLAPLLSFSGGIDEAPWTTTVRVVASADEGRSWQQIFVHQVTTSDTPAFDHAFLAAVPHAPRGPDLYLTAGSQLFRSLDGGATWQLVLERDWLYGKVVANPADPRELYLGSLSWTGGGRVVRSLDGGSSWTDLPAVEPESAETILPIPLAVAPSDPPALFARARNAVYKSTDHGATWRPIDFFHLSPLTQEIHVDPGDPARLTAVERGLYTSTDGGESWKFDEGSPYGVQKLRIDTATRRTYALREAPLPSSRREAGGEWTCLPDRGILVDGVSTYERGAHPSVFLRGDGSVSADGGRTWLPASTSRFDPFSLAVNPEDPRLRYALGPDGTYRSLDGGGHWSLRSRKWFGCPYSCKLTFVARDELLAGADCGLERSTDGGRTWKETLSCQSAGFIQPLRIHPNAPRTIYAHALTSDLPGERRQQRLYRSTDGGATWHQTFAGEGLLALAPGNPNVVYLSRPQGFYRSANGGRTFARTGEPACSSPYCLINLEIDGHDPDRLYAATLEGVFRSTDAGRSWQPLRAGLEEYQRTIVERLVLHPWVPGLVYAYPSRGGTFEGRFP